MHRREILKLGAIAGGTILLGGTGRFRSLLAAPKEIPTIDRLVITNLVDNVYDIFAKGGKLGDVTVTRNTLPFPYGSDVALLSEHGLAYHLESFRGAEEKQILLDFALTPHTLTNNYQVEQTSIMIDVTVADDQGIGLGRVNSQSLVVVCEGVRREREVQQDLLFLGSPEGLQMIGQPMLREQRDVRAVGEGQVISFDVDVAKFSAFREAIIDVVDQVGHDQPVYRWDFLGRGQEAAKATCATQQDRSACDCSELQDFTPVHDWPPSSISA